MQKLRCLIAAGSKGGGATVDFATETYSCRNGGSFVPFDTVPVHRAAKIESGRPAPAIAVPPAGHRHCMAQCFTVLNFHVRLKEV
eukprot:g8267.t1